jgi:hypothetical protein
MQRGHNWLNYAPKMPTIAIDVIGRAETKNPQITRIYAGFVYVVGRGKTRYWWRRRESNPRPQALYRQFYILSHVI